jgi:hypothetical protein
MPVRVYGLDNPESGVVVSTRDAAKTTHYYEFELVEEGTLRLDRREYRLDRLPPGETSPKTPHTVSDKVAERLSEEGFRVIDVAE